MSRSRSAAFLIVLASNATLAVPVGTAAAGTNAAPPNSAPFSVALGGPDRSVDTLPEVRNVIAVMASSAWRSRAQQVLRGLTVTDQRTVIYAGLAEFTQTIKQVAGPPAPPPSVANSNALVTAAAAARYQARWGARHRPVMTAHAASTHQVTYQITGHSLAGVTLYRYDQRWHWNYSRSRVTAATHNEFDNGTFLFWNYDGSRVTNSYGRLNSGMIGRETQGKFELNVPVWGHIQTSKAFIEGAVYGNGGTWHNGYTTGL